MAKKKKYKKNMVQKLGITFAIISIIGIIVWAGVYALNYTIDKDEMAIDEEGNIVTQSKKTEINALICGKNENLTDTIIYLNYNVNSGKIAMMSIPRDTSIVSNPTLDSSLKINYVYTSKGADALVSKVENLLGVNIDYYLVFDASMLKEMVDTIGGVEVDVPMRMKYDDPTQNLHINLQKGVQVLNGDQAEQFVRFRHNNDMTVGYPLGDVQRTKVQQEFIKKFIKTVLSTSNIPKIPQLINIALKNTDTNITAREALKYVKDIAKIDLENIYSCTAPGTLKDVGTKGANWMSFYILDKTETVKIIEENFKERTGTNTDANNNSNTNNSVDNNKK